MRVLNLNTLKGDVFQYFGFGGLEPTSEEGKKYLEWLLKMWVRHFQKTQEGFFHTVVIRKLPSFFKTDADTGPKRLRVSFEDGEYHELTAEDEFDIKDAEAGTLFYYSPRRETIYKFAGELTGVRDFLMDEARNGKDIVKRSFDDVKRSAQRWHDEQRRQLEARMAAEAADRLARVQEHREQKLSTSKPSWEEFRNGTDYERVHEGFLLGGKLYTLFRLTSPRSLDYESIILDHCVHTYRNQIFDRATVIWSVREVGKEYEPLVTIEVHNDIDRGISPYIIQVRGYGNHDPNQTIKGINAKIVAILDPNKDNREGLINNSMGPLVTASQEDLSFKFRT